MATTAEMISAIDAQISALTTTLPVDYTEGDLTVKNSQKMKQLLEARKVLSENPDADMAIMVFHNIVDEFGIDRTQYF